MRKMPGLPFFRLTALAAATFLCGLHAHGADAPVSIPVLVITTYEAGNDRGDLPGELQFWVEREHLDQEIAVPGVDHPLMTNGRGLYVMVSGTTSRCTAQIMALAGDPRFDLRKTYFLLAGIGGGDPNEMPLGSALWVQTVVDGDPAFEIDPRDMPASWPYGIVALGATRPGEGSADVDLVPAAGASTYGTGGVGKVAFRLNPSLVAWAYGLTKTVPLDDDPAMRTFGRRFAAYPEAAQPPRVMLGDSLGGDRFFHGALMMRWAEDWVKIYTHGKGSLAMSDCEDQGVCLALQRLGMMGKVDSNRLLILRTACNYILPPPGVTTADSLFGDTVSDTGGMAYLPALEADYRVGSVVVLNLLQGWDKYRDQIP
jgi:purine nucleoside permease